MLSLSKPQSVKMALQSNSRFSARPPDPQVGNQAKTFKNPICQSSLKNKASGDFAVPITIIWVKMKSSISF